MASSPYTVAGEGFEIRFSLTAGVLRAQVEGPDDSYAISLGYWTCISEERRRCGAQRVLVIENLKRSARSDETLALFDDLTRLGFEGCKVAFVDSASEHRSLQEYIAIMARELDILAGVFGEESEAAIWLRHGEE